jgi:hypothetical protein
VAKISFKNTFLDFFFFSKNYDTVYLLRFEVKISENFPPKKKKITHKTSLAATEG